MVCGVFFARRWGSLGSIVQGQGAPASTASSAGRLNWQRGTWPFGLEADIQGSDERGSADVCIVAGCALGNGGLTENHKLVWYRARPCRFPPNRPRPALRDRRSGLRPTVRDRAADPVELGLDPRRLDHRRRRRGRARPQLVVQGRVPLHGSRQYRRCVGNGDPVTNALNTPSTALNAVTPTTTTAVFNTNFTDNLVRVA
jgi:outer membrane immunogenic protein